MKPKVSVVIPVYNVEKYVRQAIKSVLDQTFKDFEIVIIDDGSTDHTLKVIKSFKDKRIKVFKNPKNLGLVESINKGINESRGEYIARFDGDDICERERFKKQVEFLDNNPDYVIVGSQEQQINPKGEKLPSQYKVPQTDQEIRRIQYLWNFMIHPTVMMRKDVVVNVGGYRKFFKGGAEEYDLWLRMLRFGKFYNLKEKLIKKRIHPTAFTQLQRFKRIELFTMIARFVNLPIIRDIGIDGLIGGGIFIIYKFWLISFLFKNRTVPPEPDDIYNYLSSAVHLFQITSFEDFRLLLFSAWINLIAIITGGNFEKAIEINFYLGTLILCAVLIYLVRSITGNLLHRIILLIFLALFNGSGAYHGFYWVVSSFYLLTAFLLLVGIINSPQKVNKSLFIITTIVFTIVHPSSLLVIFSFLIYGVFNKLFLKQNTIFVRSILVVLLSLVVYSIYSFIGNNFITQEQIAIAPQDNINLISNILQGNLAFPSWSTINREYFYILMFHPLSITGFILCLILTWFYLSKQLIILYLSLIVLIGVSTLHPFGFRTLTFLWVTTFMVFAGGLIGLYQLIQKINKNIAFVILISVIIGFSIVATSLNLTWGTYINTRKNFAWDRSCPEKLDKLVSEKVYFSDWDNLLGFRVHGFPVDKGEILTETNVNSVSYLVVSDYLTLRQPDSSHPVSKLFLENITRKDPYPQYKVPGYYWHRDSINSDRLMEFDNIMDCGYFKVQKIKEGV